MWNSTGLVMTQVEAEALALPLHQRLSPQERVERLLEDARRLQQSGDTEGILAALMSARAFLPADPSLAAVTADAQHALAADRDVQQRRVEARHLYRSALRIRPLHASIWVNLGVSLGASHHLVEAQHATRQAIRLEPRSSSHHCNLGLLHERQVRLAGGSPAEALHSFQVAQRLVPHDGSGAYHAANLLKGMGRTAEAVEAFEAGVSTSPFHAGLRSNLGFMRIGSGSAAHVIRGVGVLWEGLASGVWRRPWQFAAEVSEGLEAFPLHPRAWYASPPR